MRCFSLSGHRVSTDQDILRASIITQSRIEHVQRHLVALRCTSDSNKSLVAVILRLIDFDDTPTQLADLVDLRTSLADDCPDHVVGDVDLLRQWLAWDNSLHRLRRGSSMGSRHSTGCLRLWGHGAIAHGRGAAIAHRGSRWLRDWCLSIRLPILSRGRVARTHVMVAEIFRMTKAAACRLGHVRDDLHPTRYNTGGASAACRIRRRRRPAKTIGELLQESACDVVRCDMHSVGNTKNDKRSLSREWEAGVRRVQTGTGLLLNLLDARTTLSNNCANQNMGDQQAEGISSRLRSGWLIKRLVVQCSNDQPKCLMSCQPLQLFNSVRSC